MLLGLRPGRVEIDVLVVALVVVEDHFEHPGRLGQVRPGSRSRDAIPVLDALQIAVGRAHAVALVGLAAIYVVVVLCRVLVDDGVALVVVARADEPTEDARRVGRRRVRGIEDAGVVVLPVQRGHVVAGDRAPVDLAGCDLCPALDAGEQALDAGAVAERWIDEASGADVSSREVAVAVGLREPAPGLLHRKGCRRPTPRRPDTAAGLCRSCE